MACILATMSASSQRYANPANKLRMAEMAISQFYVDSIDENKIVEDAIRGMLSNLDPHSAYSSAEEIRALNEPLEGKFSGIGISFRLANDTLRVISIVSGGPSERVGLLAGDRIIAVNDTVIAGVKITNTGVQRKLRGPKGSEVNVKVLRPQRGGTDTIDFRIVRDDIPIYSIGASYMVDATTGYVRVDRFANSTPKEFAQAVKKLKKDGMKQLIIDLVDNTGGFLTASTDMLSEILSPGVVSLYTEGLRSPRHDFISRPAEKKPLVADCRLVVMVNQNSASAAEIVAGGVQDWDRGLIVGRRTFGKGLVQRPIPFPDGSMIRLTVAHYYTPSGRSIQKPFEKGKNIDYAYDIVNRFRKGELMHADSVKHDPSQIYHTLVRNREIYGGGGIYPDVFVPLDTTEFTNYYRDLMAKGVLVKYAGDYADSHRKELRKLYRNDNAFVDNFIITDGMTAELRALAEQQGVKTNEKEAETSKPLIDRIIKALIGRDVFDTPTYFKVYNRHDPIFNEAYRLINSPEYDEILSFAKKIE